MKISSIYTTANCNINVGTDCEDIQEVTDGNMLSYIITYKRGHKVRMFPNSIISVGFTDE